MSKRTEKTGPGFLGLLTIVFIVLKLIGEISWGWVWVLSPIWIPITVLLVSLGIIVVISTLRNGR